MVSGGSMRRLGLSALALTGGADVLPLTVLLQLCSPSPLVLSSPKHHLLLPALLPTPLPPCSAAHPAPRPACLPACLQMNAQFDALGMKPDEFIQKVGGCCAGGCWRVLAGAGGCWRVLAAHPHITPAAARPSLPTCSSHPSRFPSPLACHPSRSHPAPAHLTT